MLQAQPAAGNPLAQGDRVDQRRLGAAADVVGRAARGPLHCGDGGRDHVAHVSERARGAPVAEERELTARRQRRENARERHVRPLLGPYTAN
jgi:hypothetical protein